MSKILTDTLFKVVSEQATRLGYALKKTYSEHQSMFLAKQCVAAVYGFEHWASMSYFIKRNEAPFDDPAFSDVFLHPKTISENSPSFIHNWNEKKNRIAKILNFKPIIENELRYQERYHGDELANYLAKMYGFKSMSEIWMNLRYHLEKNGQYFCLADYKERELLIRVNEEPVNSEFIQELIVNQSAFGSTMLIAPKEWFKYELDSSTISISNFTRNKGLFHGWTIGRLTSLFMRDIEERHGNFIATNSAKSLLSTILPILIYDSVKHRLEINTDAFSEILKLKNILLIINDDNYPSALQFLVKEYLHEIGYDSSSGCCGLKRNVQAKHNHATMLISSVVLNLNNFFSENYFSLSDDLLLIDVESYGYMEQFELKHYQSNFANEVMEEIAELRENSMMIIYDDNKMPASGYQLDSLRSFCELKGIFFVLITSSANNYYKIKNEVVLEKDGFISDLLISTNSFI